MASHEIYSKTPLDLKGQSIRLIEILSASETTGITLTFHTRQLHANPESAEAAPEYFALSYTWGHTANQRRVVVDGTEFYVRENLWLFLQQQRYLLTGGYLAKGDLIWIDALCIDQGNIPERNHQVMMMASIFSQARHVLVWLGPAEDDSDEAMYFLDNIPVRGSSDAWRRSDAAHQWQHNIHKHKPLLSLFQRPYWKRMWIVQELRLSRGWTLLCGQMQVEWTHIKEFCLLSHRFWESNKRVKAILSLACWRSGGDRLTTLFRSCKEQQCEDPRDKIYALLGLVGKDGHDIPIDYSLSRVELYARVLKSTLKCDVKVALNNMQARSFERDLYLNLGIAPDNPAAEIEKQNFLHWCSAFQDFREDLGELEDLHPLPLSFFDRKERHIQTLQTWAEEKKYMVEEAVIEGMTADIKRIRKNANLKPSIGTSKERQPRSQPIPKRWSPSPDWDTIDRNFVYDVIKQNLELFDKGDVSLSQLSIDQLLTPLTEDTNFGPLGKVFPNTDPSRDSHSEKPLLSEETKEEKEKTSMSPGTFDFTNHNNSLFWESSWEDYVEELVRRM